MWFQRLVVGSVLGLVALVVVSVAGFSSRAALPDDRSRAAAAVLKPKDFPAAFSSQSGHAPNQPVYNPFLCVDTTGLMVTGSAMSDEFVRGNASQFVAATSRAVILDGKDEAKTFYARWQLPGMYRCLADRIAFTFTRHSNDIDITWKAAGFDRVGGPQEGDQSFTTRYRFTVTSTRADQRGDVVVDVTTVRVGDVISAVSFFSRGVPFDQRSATLDGPASHDLVHAVASRMQPS